MAAWTDRLTASRIALLAAAIASAAAAPPVASPRPARPAAATTSSRAISARTANLTSLGEVVQRNPNDPQAFNMRGTVLARTGRNAEALADFSRAIQIDPNYAQALPTAPSSTAAWDASTRPSPTTTAPSGRTRTTRGLCRPGQHLSGQNRYNEALGDYNRAIQINGSNAQAYHNRALVWAAQGNHRQAGGGLHQRPWSRAQQCRALLRAGPQLSLALGDAKLALDDFNEAVQFEQRNADLWVARGQALERTGDTERALGSYTKAISVEENNAAAREGFARLGGRSGQTYRLFN